MTALTLKMDTQCQFINFITWCYIYCVNHFCPKLLEMAKFCFLKWLLNELYLWLDFIDWFVQKAFLIRFCQSLSSHEINDIQCMFIMDVLFIVNCTYLRDWMNEWMLWTNFSVILSYIYTYIYKCILYRSIYLKILLFCIQIMFQIWCKGTVAAFNCFIMVSLLVKVSEQRKNQFTQLKEIRDEF